MQSVPVTIVAADHPSLDGAVEAFVHALGAEPCRMSARRHRTSALGSLVRPGGRLRLAAIEGDRIVGLVRVGHEGDLVVVVAGDRRNLGIGSALAETAAQRAHRAGITRLRLHRGRTSGRALEIAHRHGAALVRRRRHLEVVLASPPVDQAD